MELNERELRAMELIQRMKSRVGRIVESAAQQEGLTQLQCCVLLEIAGGSTTVGAVSEQTHIGQGNTSTLCKRLEQAGYLRRTRNREDERVVVLSLTDRGRGALENIGARLREYETVLEELPGQVRADILRGLAAMEVALDRLSEYIEGESSC